MRQIASKLSTIFLFAYGSALGSSCLGIQENKEGVLGAAERSELIVVGQVQELTYRNWLDNEGVRSEVLIRVKIDETLKGDVVDSEIVFGSMLLSSSRSFNVGDTYLIFASRVDGIDRLHANTCMSFLYKSTKSALPEYHASLRQRVEPMLGWLRNAGTNAD